MQNRKPTQAAEGRNHTCTDRGYFPLGFCSSSNERQRAPFGMLNAPATSTRRAAAWAATRFFFVGLVHLRTRPQKKNGRPRLRAPRAPKELGSTAIRKSRLSLPGKRQPPSAVLLATEHWLSRRVVRVLRVLVVRGIKPGQVKPSQV